MEGKLESALEKIRRRDVLAEAKGEDTGGTIAALKTELETLQSEHKEVMLEPPLCVDIFQCNCVVFFMVYIQNSFTLMAYIARDSSL